MSSPSLPIILLIPGAFLPPSCFDTFLPYLHHAGYTTVVVPLPSLNSSTPTTATCEEDTLAIRNTFLIPLVETEAKDVLLLMHSYGGVPGGAAAAGFGKVTRLLHGKGGGIIGLIYLTGNIVPEGESHLERFGNQFPPFIKTDTVRKSFP